jgi:hypothetical protein
MCCRQTPGKRSGVRISLAPLVKSIFRTDRTASTAKYRNGGPMGRRTCVRIKLVPSVRLLAGPPAPCGPAVLSGRELDKFARSWVRGSCRLVTTRLSWEAVSLTTVAASHPWARRGSAHSTRPGAGRQAACPRLWRRRCQIAADGWPSRAPPPCGRASSHAHGWRRGAALMRRIHGQVRGRSQLRRRQGATRQVPACCSYRITHCPLPPGLAVPPRP